MLKEKDKLDEALGRDAFVAELSGAGEGEDQIENKWKILKNGYVAVYFKKVFGLLPPEEVQTLLDGAELTDECFQPGIPVMVRITDFAEKNYERIMGMGVKVELEEVAEFIKSQANK